MTSGRGRDHDAGAPKTGAGWWTRFCQGLGVRPGLEILVALAIAAAVVRLFVLLFLTERFGVDTFLVRDSRSYIRPIADMVSHGTFSVDGLPEVQRTPGYPLLMTPFFTALAPSAAILAIVAVQALSSLLVALFTVRLAAAIGVSDTIALAASFAIVLLDPSYFVQGYRIATESAYLIGTVSALVLLVRGVEQEEWLPGLAGLALLSLTAYVRPISLYVTPAVAVFLLVSTVPERVPTRRRLIPLLAITGLLIHVGIVAPWFIRNERVFGVRTFSSIADLNLYEYIGAATVARAEGKAWSQTRREFRAATDSWDGNEAQRSARARDEAIAILRAEPVSAFSVLAQGAITNALDPGSGELLNLFHLRETGTGVIYKFQSMSPPEFVRYMLTNERTLLVATSLGVVWILTLWGLAVVGLWSIRSRLTASTILLVLAVAYFIGVAAGPNANARFRIPALPMMAIFAGVGVSVLARRWREPADEPAVSDTQAE